MPGFAVKGNPVQKGTPESQVVSPEQDKDRITYQDQSADAGVSFSYPIAMNRHQAPLPVQVHEREHVRKAQAETPIKSQNATTDVSVHYGYDRRGRLSIAEGTTGVITGPNPLVQPITTGNKADITA